MLITIRLKEIAREKGYTLTQIASATKISMNTLSVLGRGESKGIQFDTLDKICSFLNCKPNDILSFENRSLEIVAGRTPKKLKNGSLFEGIIVPSQLIEEAQAKGLSIYGYPIFIEVPDKRNGDTASIFVGLPESSLNEFDTQDTVGTDRYTLQETQDYLNQLSPDERDGLLSDAVMLIQKFTPASFFNGIEMIYATWITDPNKQGAKPVLSVKI